MTELLKGESDLANLGKLWWSAEDERNVGGKDGKGDRRMLSKESAILRRRSGKAEES
jgi:hypothetical protein